MKSHVFQLSHRIKNIHRSKLYKQNTHWRKRFLLLPLLKVCGSFLFILQVWLEGFFRKVTVSSSSKLLVPAECMLTLTLHESSGYDCSIQIRILAKLMYGSFLFYLFTLSKFEVREIIWQTRI